MRCFARDETSLNDRIILARTSTCPVAILVENVLGISEFSEREIIAPAER